MEKIKKLIVIIVILILITIIAFVLFKMYKEKNSSNNQETEFEQQIEYEPNTNVEKETNRNQYYATMNIANKFIDTMVDGGSETLLNMLDPLYIENYNITKENVYEKINCIDLEQIEEGQLDNLDVKIQIKDMYIIEKNVNIRIYLILGNIKANIVDMEKPYNLIVEVDSKNNTFYILPNDYVEDNNYDKVENLTNYTVTFDEIKENDYNKFNYTNIDDGTIINDYLSNYKDILIKDIKESYDLLADDYKNEKFNNYSEYEQYVNNNKKELLSISFTKYKINETENEKEYICLDKNNNYYIFKETAIMEYKIYLDDYTIDLQDFKDKYEKVEATTKVGMNVEKVIKAINRKDYNYIYKKLDSTFTQNNFPTINDFEAYMNENYFDIYRAEYNQAQTENETYIQQIELIGQEKQETKQLNIIMQLKEGTDFVMSFTI